MANTIRIDRGWNRINETINSLQRRAVKVGLLAGGPLQDGVPVIHYATWNEYGTADGHIPSRPFMRNTAQRVTRDMRNGRGTLATTANRMIRGGLSAEQFLDGIGLWYQAQMRTTIRTSQSWARPNAAYTIAKKGSSVPLIEHGVLIGAINYEKTRR